MTGEIVTLLQKTEGRDKMLKASAGLAKVLAFYTGAKQHSAMATSLSEARSIMRMCSWINNIKKLGTFPRETLDDKLMIIRILWDFWYCAHDNLTYFNKYKFVTFMPRETLLHRSFMGLFFGFLFACMIDIHILLTQNLDKKAWKHRMLTLTRNICDLLAGLHNVGYARPYGFALNNRTLGLLGFVSGAISTRDIYNAGCK